MDLKLPFGMLNGKLVHISELGLEHQGLKCGCNCPACGQALVAKMGEKKVKHFAHHREGCTNGVESALHLFAKEVLAEKKRLRLPSWHDSNGTLHQPRDWEFVEAETEVPMFGIVPDIVLRDEKRCLVVEITVTHAPEEAKLLALESNRLTAIEIYLGAEDLWAFDRERVTALIVDDVTYKTWLYNEPDSEWHKKLEEKRKRKAEEDERKRREQAENLRRKVEQEKAAKERLQLIERQVVQKLLDPAHQSRHREEWAKVLPRNPHWLNFSDQLGITLSQPPPYLCVPVAGDFLLGCDRRLWQAALFRMLIYPSRNRGTDEGTISVKFAEGMIKRSPEIFPLNKRLYWAFKSIDEPPPSLSEVVCNWFLFLENHGFIELRRGHPLRPYGVEFRRLRWIDRPGELKIWETS